MLFRGSYEVTRKLKGQDIESTRTSTLKDVNVGGKFTIAAGQIFDAGANKLTNLAVPTTGKDATTKDYVDGSVRHIHIGVDIPAPALGVHEDLYFRGSLGGKRTLVGINGGNVTDLSSDGSTILVTTDSGTGKYYASVDGGVSWSVKDAIPDPTNRMRLVLSTGPGHFFIARTKIGTGLATPLYSDNSGVTWQQATLPVVTTANVNAVVVDKDNANNRLVLLPDSGKPLYSEDHGHTWAVSNAPAGNYKIGASNGATVVISNSTGLCYKSLDGGKTYLPQGTLPAISVTWTCMAAVTTELFIVAGTGSDSGKMAFSYNAGASWVAKTVVANQLNAVDLLVNRITGVIAAAGKGGMLVYSNVNTPEVWQLASINDITHVSRDIDTFGAGFVGVSYGAIPIVAMTPHSTGWSTETQPGFVELYAKQTNIWVPLDVLQQQEADARYVNTAGGIINGNVGLNNHLLSGLSDPVNGQDAVNLRYLTKRMETVSGVFLPSVLGTISSTVDTVGKDVETFKYIISAKVGTKRYYSELNVIANGVSDPVSAEYAVMSIGGLDIETTVSKAANGDTELKIISSDANTTLYLKRIIIDF